MSRLVCSSKSLLTAQPSHISTQSSQHPDHLIPMEAALVGTFLSEFINQVALLLNILPTPASSDRALHGSPLSVQSLVENVLAPRLTEILTVQEKLNEEGDLLERRGTPISKESVQLCGYS